MLTFLTVERAEKRSFLPRRNKIAEELKSAGGIDVRHIRCIHRHGRLPYEKIARLCGSEAGRLLTLETLELPEETGLRRFYCDELRVRLSLNMGIEILKGLKELSDRVRVGVYDPQGRLADGIDGLLRFTESLTVVTRMTGIYGAEAERILNESGAVFNLSRRMKSLEKAKLVIAPEQLKAPLPLSGDAVILTTAPPAVSQGCAVFFKYFFNLSEELIKLLPQGFDAEYLASALYTLCGRYDLGSVVPQATKGSGEAHTLVSLTKYLMNITSNT